MRDHADIDIDFGKVTVFSGNYSFCTRVRSWLFVWPRPKMKAEEKKTQMKSFSSLSANVARVSDHLARRCWRS
jgi:hypothetical protein